MDIDKQFDKIDAKCDKIREDLRELESKMRNIQYVLGRLEVRLEDHTLKVIHIERAS